MVGKIPTKTWENCREKSERKFRTHPYDYLVDLWIKLAMNRENDSNMVKYLRKHLQTESPVEKAPGGRLPQLHSNPRKGRGGQLKHMAETPPPPSIKGQLTLSDVVLRTIRVDPAKRPTVIGEMHACSN